MDVGPSITTPDGFVTAAQYNELLLKHEALQKTYHQYRKDAEARASKAAQKIREAKETVRKWKEYIDKKLAKQALREANREFENQDFATPRAVQSNLENIEDALALPNPALELVRNTPVAPSHSPAHSKITSSQTTEGEAARSSSLAHSDDSPVVVSAKALKRKRNSPKKDSQAYKIKNELLSSSPHNSRTPVPTLFRAETSDLDVYRDQPPIQPPKLNLEKHPLSRAPLRQSADRDSGIIGRSFEHLETPIASRPSRSRSPNRVNTDANEDDAQLSDSTVKTVKTEPGISVGPATRENMLVRTVSKSAGPRESRPRSGPLHDLSPNTPTLPRTSAAPVTSGKKLDHSRGAAAVHVLSEDGDNTRRGFKKPRIDDATPKAVGTGRLNGLLEGTSPQVDRTILSPRSAPTNRRQREWPDNANSNGSERHTVSKSVERPVSRITRTVRDKPAPRPAVVRYNPKDDPGAVEPEHEPLRARPLHRLNLDDFRVNPKTHGELGYAYRESIRKREEKKCLPGCTREECCGAIRRFIAAGGLPQDTSLTDDELTLQGYLGSAYATVIHSATAQKRQEMLLEARAKAFADLHGKHRELFQRNRSPPGFWRTEMPTTQELEEDWEEARKMDRQKVEERWREAMRGGRYIFKDES
ncbi:SAE2-domain-containing protein [Aureobasidium sp. EXF-10727]|nr:SAE2-domain-containing protein [Aureobasidium sp. EXF-10727]